eukprot:jgi/Ulvmu1/11166/UM072_0002.1
MRSTSITAGSQSSEDKEEIFQTCSVPIGEGAEKIRPASADVQQIQEPDYDSESNGKRNVRAYLHLVYRWCFPPMKPYDELCASVEVRSFGLFHTNTKFRRACIYAVKSKAFERMSLCLILANCVFLAMDSNAPDFKHTQLGGVLQAAELVFIVAFTVEMALKMLGLGLYGAKGAYLRDTWNVIDFVVVVMGWMSLLPSVENISSMRTVRVLRPLRTITGVEGMRMLVSTLLSSLPMLLDVLILCAFLFLIFGTVGVQTFAGALRQYCGVPVGGVAVNQVLHNVTSFVHLSSEVCGDRIVQLPASGAWFATNGTSYPKPSSGQGRTCESGNSSDYGVYCFVGDASDNPNHGLISFDNILWSWLTIFQCVSLEGWTEVMYAVQDGVSDYVWVYFVVLIIVGAFFAVNLALAVLYLQFTQSQAELEIEREEQAAAISAAQQKATQDPLAAPKSLRRQQSKLTGSFLWLKRLCYRIQANPYFEVLTLTLISINTVVMASEHHEMQPWHTAMNEILNIVFTAYFTSEMVVKVLGLGPKGYMEDRMNAFDGIVVIASVVEFVLYLRGGGTGSLSVFRAFRLMRVFKLARRWEELNKIVRTIFQSLSSIAYLSLLLLVFIFIMALLGMQMFGHKFIFCDVEAAEPLCPPGMSMGDGCLSSDGCVPCPAHRDCYVRCSEEQYGSWISVLGSPYNDRAFCERFPRHPGAAPLEYWAQAGHSNTARHNFDNIYSSIITIFQILTGENWNMVMYDGMRATNSAASLYFLSIVIIGNYVVLNLFLAILLDKFAGGDEDKDDGPLSQPSESATAADAGGDQDDVAQQAAVALRVHDRIKHFLQRLLMRDAPKVNQVSASDACNDLKQKCPASGIMRLKDGHSQKLPVLVGRSLLMFGPDNPIRMYLARIVWHPRFEHIIIALMICSSIVLAIDSPSVEEDSTLKAVLNQIDFAFVIIFTCEAVSKIIVYGLLLQPGAYLKSPWNILDFLTVVVGIVLLTVSDADGQLTSLKSLRTLRALRPIRMASRAPGMKVVVNALFQSIPASGNVLLVCFLFYLIFGIMFVSLLKGTFEYCQDSETGRRLNPTYYFHPGQGPMTSMWCEAGSHSMSGLSSQYHASIPVESLPVGHELESGNTYTLRHEWVKPPANFDHIFVALLSLFEIATMEMWPDFMYAGVDATSAGQQPIQDDSPLNAMYFVAFVVVGSFFVLNLFVGVAIDKFNQMQTEHLGQNIFLTPEQEQWVTIQRLLANTKPPKSPTKPANPVRAAVFRVVMSDTFESIIMGIILLNVACLAINGVNMPEALVRTLTWLNIAFTTIFLLEAAAKMVALGIKQYFQDRWCMFDFAVAMVSAMQIVIELSRESDIPAVNLLRVFRVARIFRLVPKAKGLRTLLQTLVFSLPALVNVGSVFFLFMFIFAIMGMSLFGGIRQGEFLNRRANFDSIGTSLLVLFRMSTGESWNGIMHDCMVQTMCTVVVRPFVNAAGALVEPTEDTGIWFTEGDEVLRGAPLGATQNRCGPPIYFTVAYFMTFVLMCAFLLLNLVIAVILDNFQSSTNNEELEVSQSNLLNFAEVWSRLDHECSMYIPTARLTRLLELVEPPLGVSGMGHVPLEVQNIIMGVDIPNRIINGSPHVHFIEVLHALAGRIAGVQLPCDEAEKAHARFVSILPPQAEEYPKYSAAHYHAALHVQAAVRGFLARHDMEHRQKNQYDSSGGHTDAPG